VVDNRSDIDGTGAIRADGLFLQVLHEDPVCIRSDALCAVVEEVQYRRAIVGNNGNGPLQSGMTFSEEINDGYA
jgi:hypothetical protein